MHRLIAIQQELKAPKNQRNTFGGYNFRSCEDILEAVKPLLAKHNLALIINDEVTAIEGGFDLKEQTEKKAKHIITSNRVYIKATAILYDNTGKVVAKTSALAREEETKTGMDASQLTGATSSYARKYALNGLFAIDDNKDADSTNKHNKEETPIATVKVSDKQIKEYITQSDPDKQYFDGLRACKKREQLREYYSENFGKVIDKKGFTALKDEMKYELSKDEDDYERLVKEK